MNYQAPTRRYSTMKTEPKMGKKIKIIKDSIGHFSDLFIGFPLYILDKLGINPIPNLLSINTGICSILLCGAFLGVASSVGIALGVGLGVGLNCAKTQYISTNDFNTTNSTFLSSNSTTNNSIT